MPNQKPPLTNLRGRFCTASAELQIGEKEGSVLYLQRGEALQLVLLYCSVLRSVAFVQSLPDGGPGVWLLLVLAFLPLLASCPTRALCLPPSIPRSRSRRTGPVRR